MAADESYQLFKSETCGFCFRVRAFADRQNIALALRDVHSDAEAFRELLAGGGRSTVPCLRIEDAAGGVRWMYESLDIMRYLASRLNSVDRDLEGLDK